MDSENLVPETVETLSPAEMFLNDLNASEVESQYEDVPAEESEAVAEEQVATEEPTESVAEEALAQEPIPDTVTRDDLASTRDELIARITELANQSRAQEQTQAPVATEEAPMVEEEPVDEQALLDKFYDKPLDAINEIANQKAEKIVQEKLGEIKKELEPLLKQSQETQYVNNVRDILNQFVQDTPDANEMLDDIVDYVVKNDLARNDARSYQDAYREAKIAKQAGLINQLQQNQGKSLDDYLADENSVNQILANDNIKTKIIEDYLKGLQNGQRPATISNNGSVAPVAQPANRPTTFSDASKLFAADLNR